MSHPAARHLLLLGSPCSDAVGEGPRGQERGHLSGLAMRRDVLPCCHQPSDSEAKVPWALQLDGQPSMFLTELPSESPPRRKLQCKRVYLQISRGSPCRLLRITGRARGTKSMKEKNEDKRTASRY
uniref:Uncharacterized protein n=1 Tax=Rousettus aegyptiacus TaxID=9407 RepID=A0A7J8DI89_ROUAE|nr:hypothetical protein HJG63_008693 [Rousettus aegyptiacus]